MANGKVLKGPYWTRNWIEAMWRFTNENFVDFDTGAVDYEAIGKEEFQFRKALFFRNFKNSERAKMAFASAEDDYKNPVENGKKGGRPKKNPQDAPNGNAGVDMYDAGNGAASKSPTSCDTFTADGDIREDSQDRKSGTSANHYGDAATREGADESTTVSNNSGNGGSGTSQARQSRRTGGSSVRGMAKVAQPSVRSRAKNSRCPNSREDFHAFVADNKLHEGLAEEWYAIHEARGWVDRDGNPIKDWRGALYNYCTKTEQKRRTA